MVEPVAKRHSEVAPSSKGDNLAYVLTEGQLDVPADLKLVDNLPVALGIDLPRDYLNFLRQHDGGEGFIKDHYIIIWKVTELADFNREYEVEKYAPGIFLFGSNGGGEAYGFDVEDKAMPVVLVPFIGMDRRFAKRVTKSFSDLFAVGLDTSGH